MGVLDGKIAIVTGSARGIGREISLNLASEGASVVVNDLGGDVDGGGSGRIADEVVAEIEAAGGVATPNYDSVATVDGGRSLFRTAIDRFGGLDILVNNAGVSARGNIEETSEAVWTRTMDINVKGAFLGSKQAIPIMRTGGGGSIINVSSGAGIAPQPGTSGA